MWNRVPLEAGPTTRVHWVLLAVSIFGAPLLAGCDLGLDENDIRVPTSSTAAAGGGGDGGLSATTASTGTGAGGGNGGVGGAEHDCWSDDPSTWTFDIEPIDADALAGSGPRAPSISPDGLSLVYVAGGPTDDIGRAFRATRANRTEPFVGGELMAAWSTSLPESVDAAELNSSGNELVVASAGALLWSVPTMTEFSDPLQLTPVNTPDVEARPTMALDGGRMIFERVVGGVPQLVEGARQPGFSPGDPFGDLLEKVMVGDIADADWMVCPALSEDGLRLFFASHFPEAAPGGPLVDPSVFSIYVTVRQDTDLPFQTPVEIDLPALGNTVRCVSAVTEDGCQLTYSGRPAIPGEGAIAVRTDRRR